MVEIQQVPADPDPSVSAERTENSEWQELMGKDLMLKVSNLNPVCYRRFDDVKLKANTDPPQRLITGHRQRFCWWERTRSD